MKKFRHYILRSQIKAIVPDAAVKMLLMQNEPGEKRAKWITTLQEFDMEIIPAKLVRGQVLVQTIANMDPNLIKQQYVLNSQDASGWYDDLSTFLIAGKYPSKMKASQRRALKIKAQHYMVQGGLLFRKNHDGIYLRCLNRAKADKVLIELHDKYRTGHGSHLATTHKILRASYYWPTMFKDTKSHIRSCHTCQTVADKGRNRPIHYNL
ncbi:MAG TPA: hypothetical protein VFV08_11615 [Puia sp.]|nr:hypothetical protein [Puia sp.]